MGNNNSIMEKVYIFLPVVMFHSRMDYSDPSTLSTIRAIYFAEQVRCANLKANVMAPDLVAG